MKPPVETIRVSQKGRDTLIKIKRNTTIEHWNVLCRWALCKSLEAPSVPLRNKREQDSNVEMTWRTFAGEQGDLFTALVSLRASKDGIDLKNQVAISEYVRAHLERGISLIQNTRSLSELFPV